MRRLPAGERNQLGLGSVEAPDRVTAQHLSRRDGRSREQLGGRVGESEQGVALCRSPVELVRVPHFGFLVFWGSLISLFG
jgi:hypothetical protein